MSLIAKTWFTTSDTKNNISKVSTCPRFPKRTSVLISRMVASSHGQSMTSVVPSMPFIARATSMGSSLTKWRRTYGGPTKPSIFPKLLNHCRLPSLNFLLGVHISGGVGVDKGGGAVSDANEAKLLSEGKPAVLASVIETQDIKWVAWFHQRSTSLLKVVTCRIAQRLPRAAFGCGYILIGCYYNIPKRPIIRTDSFYFTNHLSHQSHPSHLIANGPRPSHPRDIFKNK